QRVDPARNRVWVLGSHGLFLLDTRTGTLVQLKLPLWPYGCPPDLALGPDGEAVVSNSIIPVLWRIDPETLAVTVHKVALDADTDKNVGFSGIVYSAEHGAYLAVNEAHGSLWQIDRSLRKSWKIARLTPVRGACSLALPRGAE